jgi:hypothetical protein
MPESRPIVIRAKYVGQMPLVSIIESNVDLDWVGIERTQLEVKAISPLDLVIEAVSVFVLQEYVLKPLLNPIAEKFSWKKAVARHLSPIQSFNLVVRIDSEKLLLEAPHCTNHSITAEIWHHIQEALDILKKEQRLGDFTKIRFTIGSKDEFLVICYEQSRPTHTINLDERRILQISGNQVPEDESEASPDEWAEAIEREAEAYQRYIEESRKRQDDGVD